MMLELVYCVMCVIVLWIIWYVTYASRCEEWGWNQDVPPGPDSDSEEDLDPYADWDGVAGSRRVQKLTNADINRTVKSKQSILVLFYAPWCSYCHIMIPDFARAAAFLKKEKCEGKLAAINCDAYPEVKVRHEVQGYPTINYYRDGKFIGEYRAGRRFRDFVNFMKDPPTTREQLRRRVRRQRSLRTSDDNENGSWAELNE